MKKIVSGVAVIILVIANIGNCYAAEKLNEEERKEQIQEYMEAEVAASEITDLPDAWLLKEYDIDNILRVHVMEEFLTTYNKGGKFKDNFIKDKIWYYVMGTSKDGQDCYVVFEEEEGRMEEVETAYGLECPVADRFDKSDYPELADEKVIKVEYADSIPYGKIYINVTTNKNKYMIQYSGNFEDDITGIKSGELMLEKEFYEIMNCYYDESIVYKWNPDKPEENQFGTKPFLRPEPLESYSAIVRAQKIKRMYTAAGGIMIILLAGGCIGLVRYKRKKKTGHKSLEG